MAKTKNDKNATSTRKGMEKVTREKRVDQLLYFGGWGSGLVLVAALLYTVIGNFAASQTVTYMDAMGSEQLSEVFFGGKPWLIICSDSKKALLSDGALRETFTRAGELLKEQKIGSAGVLDCSKTLPSGKTVYDRLALNVTRSPVLFLVVGGDKPIQLEPKLLKKPSPQKKSKKKTEQQEIDVGKPLFDHVKKRIDKRYKLNSITSSNDLQRFCTDRKACVLILGFGKQQKRFSEFVYFMRKPFPTLRWTYLDFQKYKLNVVKDLLGDYYEPKATYSRIVLFKEGKFRTLLMKKEPIERDIREFLRNENGEYSALKKIPTIALRSSNPNTHNNKNTNPKTGKEKKQTKPEQPPKMTPEEAKEARLEWERQRRMEMEQEAQKFVADEVENDDGYEEEEEEEEEIDLDDE